jgi:YjbE family integral membrane protein
VYELLELIGSVLGIILGYRDSGMAVRTLPPHQRRRAIIFGGGAAVALRIVFTAIAALLLEIPLLHFVGGLLLVYIALKLLRSETGEEDVREGNTMLDAIRVIVLADVVMSLDNMLAVGAQAHGDLRLLLFGLALSIPLLLVGSNVVATFMGRFPWMVWIGAAILAWTAGRMMVEDRLAHPVFAILPDPEALVPALVVLIVLGVSWVRARRNDAGGGVPEERARPTADVLP